MLVKHTQEWSDYLFDLNDLEIQNSWPKIDRLLTLTLGETYTKFEVNRQYSLEKMPRNTKSQNELWSFYVLEIQDGHLKVDRVQSPTEVEAVPSLKLIG